MRIHGTLIRWNDERGFGFLVVAGGSEEVFVHVSAFPRDGLRPHVGELVSFETEVRGDGRRQAVRVMRPGSATRPTSSRQPHRASGHRHVSASRSSWTVAAALIAICAMGIHAFVRHVADRAASVAPAQVMTQQESPRESTSTVMRTPTPPSRPAAVHYTPAYACGGRTRCTQMRSCAEATWVLRNCPNTRMDGDHDGVPCEGQWCGR